MSGQLMSSGDGGGFVHCVGCGALAAGPCARCRKPVCGDCCVLTTGGAQPWAICHACRSSGGTSLKSGWGTVIGWLVKPILVLFAIYLLLYWLFG
ncbi:MAG TPA: hypothetical protein VEX18_17060 [Polyangiaceae bacterium]|jgi:hypothetical protein|nr:hypothetical protein [Polyangiaceae bacterium]